ncbi:MAG: T9SS type A sorting domain-containing protein [Bacteroidota bacterium]
MKKQLQFLFGKLMLLGCLAVSPAFLWAQCQQFRPFVLSVDCDSQGTSDPSDDTYTVEVTISNDLNPGGTWSSGDGSFTNEPYDPILGLYNFGPYPISGGSVTMQFQDDQVGCIRFLTFIPPATCSGPAQTCPDFDLCYELVDSDNCCATYSVSFAGNLENITNIRNINMGFQVSGGEIESLAFSDPNGHMASNGVNLGATFVSGGSGMNGNDLEGDAVTLTICGEPGSTVTLDDNVVFLFVDDMPCISAETFCDDPAPFTATGTEVEGLVTAPGNIFDCPDTENHGIEGAEISITSANGQSCDTKTSNDGSYSCTFCDEGPYEICVNTTCDEPCGITDLDIILMLDYNVGRKRWTKELFFMGDLNNDGQATTLDRVILVRHLLGLDTTRITDWCKFVPISDYANLPEPSNENSEKYAAVDNCVTVTNPALESTDFMRLMLGDMDGSCSDCIHGDDKGNLKSFVFQHEATKSLLSLDSGEKIYGMTLHMDIPAGTRINGVNSPLPGLEYNVKGNDLHIIWTDLSADYRGFQAASGANLVEVLYSGSAPSIGSEGNYLLGEVSGISSLAQAASRRSASPQQQVLQINGLANVDIQPSKEALNVTIYDLMGRPVYNYIVAEGETQLDLTQSLPKGIYILRVWNESNDQSKKVFLH